MSEGLPRKAGLFCRLCIPPVRAQSYLSVEGATNRLPFFSEKLTTHKSDYSEKSEIVND